MFMHINIYNLLLSFLIHVVVLAITGNIALFYYLCSVRSPVFPICEGKVHLFLSTLVAYRQIRRISPTSLNLSARGRYVVVFTIWLVCQVGRNLPCSFNRKLDGPQSCFGCILGKKIFLPGIEPCIVQPIA